MRISAYNNMLIIQYAKFFLRALAEGGIVVCALLVAIEWLLPGSVLPYIPLPILIMGVLTLCFFARGQGALAGFLVAMVLALMGIMLFASILLGAGWHAFGVLGAIAITFVFILYYAYEKHPTLS